MAKKAPSGYFYNAQGLLVKKLDAATIKAIKARFPNKTFDFNTYKYGVPPSDPITDQLRNMNPERMDVVRKRRSKEDYKAKRRLEESDYYERNKEKILKNLKEKYRSDKTVGKTGKTLKQLTKERNIAALIKKENTQGIFPTGYTTGKNRVGFYKPELALWRDLYRSSQSPGQSRWTLPKRFMDNLPTNELGKKAWGLNNYYKNIKFIDNKTGEIIKLDGTIKGPGKTLQTYLNTTIAKETKNKNVFKKAIDSYDLKNKIKDIEIKYKGDKQRIGNVLSNVASDKTGSNILSVFEIHHPKGIKNNWWESEVAFRDANRELNFIDKELQRDYKNAPNALAKEKLLKETAKEVDKLPGGITYFFEDQRIGSQSPTTESILKGAAGTYKDASLTKSINNLIASTEELPKATQLKICKFFSNGGLPGDCKQAIKKDPEKAAKILSEAPVTSAAMNNVKKDSQKLIRLFRGEEPARKTELYKSFKGQPSMYEESLKGRFFFDNPADARYYAQRQGSLTGNVKSVDVPENMVNIGRKMANRRRGPNYGSEVILPKKFVGKETVNIPQTAMARAGAIVDRIKNQTPPIIPNTKYNADAGTFVNTTTNAPDTNFNAKAYAENNPIEVKAGTEDALKPIKGNLLKTVGKSLAYVGAPLPTALIDTYFIGKQIAEDRPAAEIAKDPLNWLGLATMSTLSNISGVTKPGKMNAALRLGMSPGLIRGVSRFAGIPGFAISTALTAYDQYNKYKNEEGLIYDFFNKDSKAI